MSQEFALTLRKFFLIVQNFILFMFPMSMVCMCSSTPIHSFTQYEMVSR